MVFDSIEALFTWACRDKYVEDGKRAKIGALNKAKDKRKVREGYGVDNWEPIKKQRPRKIPPVVITKTQEVTKRDAKGRVIDTSWTIDKGTKIEECVEIASGIGIRDVNKLVAKHPGTTPSDWHKQKGVGIIKPKPGLKNHKGQPITESLPAELHWYYSKQTGQVDIKRVQFYV